MTDRPIAFSDPMRDALLAGRKTQTRRRAKDQAVWERAGEKILARYPNQHGTGYDVGDRLWVRESYYQIGHWKPAHGEMTPTERPKFQFIGDPGSVRFEEPPTYCKGLTSQDVYTVAWYKRLARFMPRAYSRMTLLVTDVRVQRLNDISEEDAVAEGIETSAAGFEKHGIYRCWLPDGKQHFDDSAYRLYAKLWDALHGPGAWSANPFVTALTFSVHHSNIDARQVAP